MKAALLVLFFVFGQTKRPQPIDDVSSPETFREKAYEAIGDLTITATATFAEGAVVYLPAGAQVRVRAPIAIDGDVAKPVVFVAAKGKAWKGLVLEKAATLKGVMVAQADVGLTVAKDVKATIESSSFIACGVGVKVERNDGVFDKQTREMHACRLVDCWIAGSRKTGVHLDDLAGIALESCTFQQNPGALYARYANRVAVSKCAFLNNQVAVKCQWQDTTLSAEGCNFIGNRVAVFMSSKKDLDMKGNFWGGQPAIQYGKEQDQGRVDVSAPLKKAADAGASVVLKKLPKYR